MAEPRDLYLLGITCNIHESAAALAKNGAFVDHHLAHAASAFFPSPFESAAVMTADLCGEDCTTLIARGRGARLTPIRRSYLPHSLGLMYAALTQYLGYAANNDEYKVMGL